MKRADGFADLFTPWAGLTVGLACLAVVHQFGSEGTFDNCDAISPAPLLIVALLGIVITAVAALSSWRVVRGDSETPARKVIATISVGAAALFVLAMLIPIIASLILPPCFE